MVEALTGSALYHTSYEPHLSSTPDQLLDTYYQTIIPRMSQKRQGRQRLSLNAVMVRLWDSPKGKPGEVAELIEVLHKTGVSPTPQLLGEVADVIYRCADPSCPAFFRGTIYWLMPRINVTEGLRLCVAKYDGRIRFGHSVSNIKDLEVEAFERMLQDMQKKGYNLLLNDKFNPETDLYRLWLSKQLGTRWRILEIADRLKIIWPF